MAKNSKISGISVDYTYRKSNGRMYKEIEIHRRNVPTNHSYKITLNRMERIRDLLKKADDVYVFAYPNSILVQGHFEHKFWHKKIFSKILNLTLWGWIVFWIAYWILEYFFKG